MLNLIGFLIAGGIVGAIARFIVPGEDPMPWWGTVILGAAAGIIGGWIAGFITPDNQGFPWIGALIAGVGLVLGVRFFRNRRAS